MPGHAGRWTLPKVYKLIFLCKQGALLLHLSVGGAAVLVVCPRREKEGGAMSEGSGKTLRVITLNAWGMPVAPHIDARIQTLATWLEKNPENVDVVALQEVFRERDVALLLAHAQRGSLRHAHVACAGPGFVCTHSPGYMVFSRYAIEDTAFHCYSVNGKPQRLLHLDWWVGKGVVLVRLADTRVGPVDVYVTHTVAAYVDWDQEGESDEALAGRDEYATQRVLQAYECAQWIQLTRRKHAGCVLLGDFNAPPYALSTQVLREWGRFQDVHAATGQHTYLPTSSKYRTSKDVSARLDYIFALEGQWKLHESWISFAPPAEISDHVGVGAELERLPQDELLTTGSEILTIRTRVELMLRMGIMAARHARWVHRATWVGACGVLLFLRGRSAVFCGPWLEWSLILAAWGHFCIACTTCNADISAYTRTLHHLLHAPSPPSPPEY